MKATGNLFTLLFLLFLWAPAEALALVNINTAGNAELESLPEIGPAKAQAIIDYRTGPSGPFETKEEIMDVSGIGPATYETIKDLITVGEASTPGGSSGTTGTGGAGAGGGAAGGGGSGSSGGSGTEAPPLKSVQIEAPSTAVAQAPSRLFARATDTKGQNLSFGVRASWNFGDGSLGDEQEALHTYAYAGAYIVTVAVRYKGEEISARTTMKIVAPNIALTVPGDGSLEVVNGTEAEVDLGGWMIIDRGATFVIPPGTVLAAGATLRFSPAATGLAGSPAATLYFPSGIAVPAAPVAKAAYTASVPVARAAPPQDIVSAPLGAAAAAAAPATDYLPWAGLATVLVFGIAGAWFARRSPSETKPAAEEFDIE
ncbi:MAG: helix-hairpin-helix domain-containing protein [Patescibacteria group bacterium]